MYTYQQYYLFTNDEIQKCINLKNGKSGVADEIVN